MGVTVGELQIIFDAETKQAKKDFAGLEKRLGRFEKKATTSTKKAAGGFKKLGAGIKKLGPMVAGLSAVLGPAVFGAATRSALQFGDTIGKTAKKVGFSSDALQELRFGADQTGIKVETLDLALQRFSRRVGEASVGTGEAKGALEEMGIALFDSEDRFRGNEAILSDFADALKKTGSSSDKLRLAFKLFDSEGAGLVNLLGEGSEVMNAFRQEARDLGLVIDSHLIQRSEELNMQLKVATTSISTTFKEALIGLSPSVVTAAEGIAFLTEGIGALIAKFLEADAIDMKNLEVQAVDAATELSAALLNLRELEKAAEGFKGVPIIGTISQVATVDAASRVARAQAEVNRLEGEIKRRSATPEAQAVGTGTGAKTPEQIAAEKALESLRKSQGEAAISLETELRQARLEALDPLLAELDVIEEKIKEQEKLTSLEGDAALTRDENIARLRDDQKALQDERADALEMEAKLNERLTLEIGKVNEKDFERARLILEALKARQLEALSVADLNEEVQQAIIDLENLKKPTTGDEGTGEAQPNEKLADSISGSVSRGALRGLTDAFSGEGVDIAETFSEVFGDIFQDSMTDLLKGLSDQLSDLISIATEGMGEGLGKAFGIGVGIVGQLAARQFGGTDVQEKRTTSASAVDSSQAIRGVVAGPTSIPIAQVGNAIRDAGAETLDELQAQTSVLELIAARLAGLSGGGGGGGGLDLTASETLG